jgi:hypothetical protein
MTDQKKYQVRDLPHTLSESKQMPVFKASAAKNWTYTLIEQLKVHCTPDRYIMVTAVHYL